MIPIEQAFRYLGARINVAARNITEVIDTRFRKAATMARRLARMPLNLMTKVRVIRAKILPLAMYGVENAQPNEVVIKGLSTAIVQCLEGGGGKRGKGDMDLVMRFTPGI